MADGSFIRLYARSLAATAAARSVCMKQQKWVYPNRIVHTPHTLCIETEYTVSGKPNLLLLLLLLVGLFFGVSYFSSKPICVFVPSPCVRISDSAACCLCWCVHRTFLWNTLRFCARWWRKKFIKKKKRCLLGHCCALSLYTAATCRRHRRRRCRCQYRWCCCYYYATHKTRSERNESSVWWSSAVTTDSVSPSWICYEIQNGGRFIFY